MCRVLSKDTGSNRAARSLTGDVECPRFGIVYPCPLGGGGSTSGALDCEVLLCLPSRDEDLGGTFPGGMLYMLERSPGVLGEVSGECLPLPSS